MLQILTVVVGTACTHIGRFKFILVDVSSVQTNLGKLSMFAWLYVSGIKTSTRRIMRLDEQPSAVVRLGRQTHNGRSFVQKNIASQCCSRLNIRNAYYYHFTGHCGPFYGLKYILAR